MEYPCGKFSNCSFVRFGSVAFSRDVLDGFFKFGSVSFRFSEKPWVRFGFGKPEPNRSQKVKPEILVSVAFLKTKLVSYK